jgi:hypothetical protein
LVSFERFIDSFILHHQGKYFQAISGQTCQQPDVSAPCQLATEEAGRAAARLLTQGEAGVNDYSISSRSFSTQLLSI